MNQRNSPKSPTPPALCLLGALGGLGALGDSFFCLVFLHRQPHYSGYDVGHEEHEMDRVDLPELAGRLRGRQWRLHLSRCRPPGGCRDGAAASRLARVRLAQRAGVRHAHLGGPELRSHRPAGEFLCQQFAAQDLHADLFPEHHPGAILGQCPDPAPPGASRCSSSSATSGESSRCPCANRASKKPPRPSDGSNWAQCHSARTRWSR